MIGFDIVMGVLEVKRRVTAARAFMVIKYIAV